MSTTPPTDAQMDAWFQTNVVDWITGGNGGILPWPFDLSISNSAQTYSAVYVGWTDSASDQHFEIIGDPTTDYDDATFRASAAGVPQLNGLIAEYGAINLRKYAVAFPGPSDIQPVSATDQSALNDSANWVAAP